MSKKKNPLSVWYLHYNTRYYWTHPWCLFKDLYWNWRNFWHRGRYGFAYSDVWNLGDWAPRVIAEALRYLAEHSSGYPGTPPWETPEKWQEHLKYLANQFQRCADFIMEECPTDERNEYKEAHEEIMRHAWKEKIENGVIHSYFEITPEEKELNDKYFARQEELRKVDKKYAREVFGWFGENLDRYWD